MASIAVYPGSFDPVTYGHLDVMKRAVSIFGKVVVAVANNPNKKYLFTLEDRVVMLKEATKGMKGIVVEGFDGLIVDLARRKKAKVLVRGLRMTADFEYEFQMAETNRRLAADVETVFLMPSEGFSFLSSTLLKEVAKYGATLTPFVPVCVARKMKVLFKK
ncbi:MAG: pantetheine-phosphate adenylyltransferase [Candidatus Omnitrophica bacterium]|nr:pantetheine-phosphate adenylyltransferase [Candidatus Omnitrophota bacterium]